MFFSFKIVAVCCGSEYLSSSSSFCPLSSQKYPFFFLSLRRDTTPHPPPRKELHASCGLKARQSWEKGFPFLKSPQVQFVHWIILKCISKTWCAPPLCLNLLSFLGGRRGCTHRPFFPPSFRLQTTILLPPKMLEGRFPSPFHCRYRTKNESSISAIHKKMMVPAPNATTSALKWSGTSPML